MLKDIPPRGRDVELGILGDALDNVASGRLTIVIVEGEAGIGKTKLLDTALADARVRGMEVFVGRAEELERTRPFGVIKAALGCSRSSPDARRATIAALLTPRADDPTTVSTDPGLQFQAVDAFVELVEALAIEQPVVIGVDDLQWADPSSSMTLAALARELVHTPVALIGCMRPLPRSHELERALQVVKAAGAHHLMLGGLGDDAVRDLVAEVVAAEPGPELMAWLSAAGGNPFFVTELLAAIREEGAIRTVEGRADVLHRSLPPNVRLTILRHVSFLPEDTLEVLRSATILGSSFLITDLATTTEYSVFDLSQVLASAITAGVLEDEGDRLRFRHDLIRDAVYEDIPQSMRRALHHEVGQRLAAAGAPTLRVAEHLARGAARGNGEAVAWLTRAAHDAAPTSPAIAADLLERAINLADPSDPKRDYLIIERASSLWWAGHIVEAKDTCEALLSRDHDPSVDGSARLCLARSVIAQGRMSDALEHLERVHQSPAVTDGEKAGAWAWASMANGSLGDLDGAAAAATKARATAASAGQHVATSLAVNSLAAIAELRGELGKAVQLIDEALRLADQSPNRVGHRYPVHVTRGHILMEVDRFQDARSTLEIGRRMSEETGVRWALPSFQVFLALQQFVTGEWDDAIAEFEAALVLAEETGERYSVALGHCVMCLIALHRGDLRRAREEARTAEGDLTATGVRFRSHWLGWVRALLQEADGAIPEAFATLAARWDECARAGLALEYRVFGPDLVRLALATGEERRAEEVAAAVDELATANDAPSLTGAALRCRGLLARDPGMLLASVDCYKRSSRPLESALTREDAGSALVESGDTQEALTHLDQALGTLERLDAARDVARIEARLRHLGFRRGRRGPRRRPAFGWESLTPTELRVADFVALGLTNPQIGKSMYISRRTVQTHLAHIFAKLDISSRTQLAAEVTQQRDQG